MAESELKTIKFHYLKSNFFRVLHIDGAIGGITPSGMIHMSLFNERAAIPREVTHTVTKDGKLGEVVDTVTKEGIVREMEVDVILNHKAAILLHEWLTGQIEKFEIHKPSN